MLEGLTQLTGQLAAFWRQLSAAQKLAFASIALIALGAFALLYQLYGGLKAIARTDIVQVALLVMGGLVVSYLTLDQIGGGQGVLAGFGALLSQLSPWAVLALALAGCGVGAASTSSGAATTAVGTPRTGPAVDLIALVPAEASVVLHANMNTVRQDPARYDRLATGLATQLGLSSEVGAVRALLDRTDERVPEPERRDFAEQLAGPLPAGITVVWKT